MMQYEPREGDMGPIHTALQARIDDTPRRASDVVDGLARRFLVDPQHVYAALWDLIEDEDLVYTAAATVRRR